MTEIKNVEDQDRAVFGQTINSFKNELIKIVNFKLELLSKNINSKTVMVTGAGGSIGSELSRQIIKLNPKKIILVELSEFALYKINEDLKNINKSIKIIPLLINIQNKIKIEQVFNTFNIDTVYHAAAYKHVP